MVTVGNQEMVRVTNQKLILNLIKERKSISRADIAKALNLSPPSTSSNINQLLEMNLILETGEGESAGGRKPILIELNRNYGYSVAIDMCSGGEIKVTLGNICAEAVSALVFKIREDDTGICLLVDLINSINSLVKENNIHKSSIKVILIAAPGIFDRASNKLTATSHFYGWNDLDLIGALEAEFKANIIVKNHVSAGAYGEYQFGIQQKCRNMMYINADNGIGAGLIINGELYEGSTGAAGMIGYTAFSREQIGGIYKKTGYLEATASSSKLVQKIKNTCKNDRALLELCGSNINRLDFGVLKRAYEKNHQIVKNELDRVVDLIAITAANINSMLNVDTIILGGKMATLGEYYILSIKRIIGELCPITPYILYSTLKDNSALYGLLAFGQQFMLEDI